MNRTLFFMRMQRILPVMHLISGHLDKNEIKRFYNER